MKRYHVILLLAFGLIVLLSLIGGQIGANSNPVILRASLKDGQYIYELSFYKDSTCVNEITGMFFYQEEIHGNYILTDSNTIHFTKVPYDREGFIPKELYIDRDRNVLTFSPNPEKLYDMFTFYIWEIRI